ncbi:hypothetical protein FISHEDRAFT_39627 [Fistulina hepatica ATCC 64428]|uniref:AAA protein C-terminal winged helix domain-containing protein n=1 Tax=Fistulina hepatica ATCC 64428 TaxID=1128425 RepID=A0A0D7AGL5_9AGAR|nr:hypothetical protein FISHEDRAFT_39627 [Fistulina hepatica ATCC 64428]
MPRHEVQEKTEALHIPLNPPGNGSNQSNITRSSGSSFVDAALTTVIGLTFVFIGGVAYVKWYKKNVLDKIELAFAGGYDPALELATRSSKHHEVYDRGVHGLDSGFDPEVPWTQYLRRKEQDLIDRIVHGHEESHYWVLLGPKVCKGTMIFDAMAACQAEGVSMCDAHPDLEVFRLKLGKALNFEYNEDSQTGLFQRRDPREGGPALDIERAMNKLEKVALRHNNRTGKPLVLIINNVHCFKNDEEGRNMILQLQQRAEAWSAKGILTLVFSTDHFWPFYVMRKHASRMNVVSTFDLDDKEAIRAFTKMRMDARRPPLLYANVEKIVSMLGGRLSFLSKASKSPNPVETASQLMVIEKAWLLSQIGLIPDCDDDVMDEQKWSSCSWLLLREFAKQRRETEREHAEKIASGEWTTETAPDVPLPVFPYVPQWKCRQIMTRADFLEELDRKNIIAIDVNHNVRPDSMLILHAAIEVTEEEGFDELLSSVRNRVDEIESLHRTRELTFKDVDVGDCIRLTVDKGGARLVQD